MQPSRSTPRRGPRFPQLRVPTPEVDQLVVRAVLDDAAVVHHQDLIGVDGL